MKVCELIEKLQGLDGNLDVLCFADDANFQAQNHFSGLLEITSVGAIEGEALRSDDGLALLRFGHTTNSRMFAIIEITGDF